MTVAILIPAYNAAPYISDCLESVLAQTYPDFRAYVMNDGSTDNTLEIIENYSKKDKRILPFTGPNQGVTKTRNALLDKVEKDVDFIFYLDADDFIHPQTLERLRTCMDKYQADVVECGIQPVGTSSYPFPFQDLSNTEGRVVRDMSVFWSNKTRIGRWINVVNKLYKWDKIRQVRFSEKLAYEEDYFYSCEVNAQIGSKVLIPDTLYYYRENPTSATHQVNYEKYVNCAINRIQLSYDTFLKTNRVPTAYLTDFQSDLAKDAFRMIVRKNLKKNKNRAQCRTLFRLAGDTLIRFQREKVVDFSTLSIPKKMAVWSCTHRLFYLTKILVYLSG